MTGTIEEQSLEQTRVRRWSEGQPDTVQWEWRDRVEVHQYQNGLTREDAEIRAYEELTGM